MKVFTCSQIQAIDSYTITNEPIASIDLMERASRAIMKWIAQRYSSSYSFLIYAGPGNNGGDGVALARLLNDIGYYVKLFVVSSENYSPDHKRNLERLLEQGITKPIFISSKNDFPTVCKNAVIVDCLFGSGLTRPLSGLAAQLVVFLNNSGGFVISVDIPSGLFGERNPCPNKNVIVKANVTLTLQFPKLSFFFPNNHQYTGEWHCLDIGLHPEAIEKTQTPYQFIDESLARKIRRYRCKFDHKGNYGHCLIVAGSKGMFGASLLSAHACIKAGAGLVTVHTPSKGIPVLHLNAPELMVQSDSHNDFITNIPLVKEYSALGIGPGLGQHAQTLLSFTDLLDRVNCPIVIDADGLNLLANSPALLNKLPKNSVLTPHIGEFDRLFGSCKCGDERLQLAISVAKKYDIIIVLKGAYTQIVCPNGEVFFNSTGNPGMATAGSGDVLTGILVSLLGQGYDPIHASILSVFLHGKAGDVAAMQLGVESLNASDIISRIPLAYLDFD